MKITPAWHRVEVISPPAFAHFSSIQDSVRRAGPFRRFGSVLVREEVQLCAFLACRILGWWNLFSMKYQYLLLFATVKRSDGSPSWSCYYSQYYYSTSWIHWRPFQTLHFSRKNHSQSQASLALSAPDLCWRLEAHKKIWKRTSFAGALDVVLIWQPDRAQHINARISAFSYKNNSKRIHNDMDGRQQRRRTACTP